MCSLGKAGDDKRKSIRIAIVTLSGASMEEQIISYGKSHPYRVSDGSSISRPSDAELRSFCCGFSQSVELWREE